MGRRRWPIALTIVTIVSLAAGGIVLASIPDSNGVIHGCYKKNGQLRVVDTAQETCGSSETALSWSQRGPAGPPGPPGSASAAPQIIGGSNNRGDSPGEVDQHMGLFGYSAFEPTGWSPMPVGGTVADFNATLWFLPGGFHEFERHRDVTITFTVMCRHRGGPTSACDGHGPGPVATPVGCSISQKDYAAVPGNPLDVQPHCTDTSAGDSFDFGAGDWISVRVRKTGADQAASGNRVNWTASFTPLS